MDSEEPRENPPTLFMCKQETWRDLPFSRMCKQVSQQEACEKILELKIRRGTQYSISGKGTGFERFTTRYKLYLGNTCFMISIKWKKMGLLYKE